MQHSTQITRRLALPFIGLALCAASLALTMPAQATAQDAKRAVRVTQGEPYAVVRGKEGSFNISGSSDDWPAVKAAQRAIPGEFIWFREDGRDYVIQDAAVMAQVRTAWAPLDRLGARMDVHSKQMDVHSKKMDELGRQMDRVAVNKDNLPSERDMREIDGGMQALSQHMERLSSQMESARDQTERERLSREMAATGARMNNAARQIGQAYDSPQMRKSHASMEAIGRQMEEAGKPMHVLGERMGVLGKEMERESKIADKTVRALIREARAKGLARPAPAAS
ncbi:putative nucleic acid-binding Zn-ribbon protein [Massilia sp. MP_M2]|uniref:hypothetical protein n=1 Tax=Massilia sp. MP_M2 TaxID=3071713 RepID=UPI00319E1C44